MLWVKVRATKRERIPHESRPPRRRSLVAERLAPGACKARCRPACSVRRPPYLLERMFPPSVRTRTPAAPLRAVDRAIDFATLGESGIEDPALEPAARSTPRGGRSAASRRPAP